MPVISLPDRPRQWWRRPGPGTGLPPVLLPLLLAAGAYAASLAHGFVYDDVYIIVENEVLHSLTNLGAVLTAPWWPARALYRPVTQLTFAVDWAIAGGGPWVFHFTNVLLHVVCSYLVLRLARLLLPSGAALTVACLFAVHPVHVEAVASVVGRAEVLATIFTLAAVLLYVRDGDPRDAVGPPLRWRLSGIGVLAMALLAYASKESALALPGVLWITDWIVAVHRGEDYRDRVKRHPGVLVGSFVIAVAWIVGRVVLLGDLAGDHPGPGLYGEDIGGRVVAMAPVVLEWVRLLVFPLHLSADYSPDYLPHGWGIRAALGLATVVTLAVLGFGMRRRFPPVSFALAWIGGTLLVVANIVVPTGILLAERSLYLPSVGFCILCGWVVTRVRPQQLAWMPLLVGVVVGLGFARTVARVPVWRNPTTFFPQLVRDAPGSFRSYWVAGAIAYQLGDREEGERLMRTAIAVYPLFPNLWNSLAIELERDQRWKEAGDFFAVAYRLDQSRLGDAVSAVSNYIRGGELDSAAAVVTRATAAGTDDYRLNILQAEIELGRNRPAVAMALRRQVALDRPDVWQYWYLTAEAAVRAGDCAEAVGSLARVAELISDFEDNLRVTPALDSLGCR